MEVNSIGILCVRNVVPQSESFQKWLALFAKAQSQVIGK